MNRQFALEGRLAETFRDWVRKGEGWRVRDLGFDPEKVNDPDPDTEPETDAEKRQQTIIEEG